MKNKHLQAYLGKSGGIISFIVIIFREDQGYWSLFEKRPSYKRIKDDDEVKKKAEAKLHPQKFNRIKTAHHSRRSRAFFNRHSVIGKEVKMSDFVLSKTKVTPQVNSKDLVSISQS